tara:strand:+ start:2671 stop:3492 length:822 start_codon:yes stop_codon:yes gene_type:complete
MSIDSFGFHIGPIYLRFYGIIIVTGAILGGFLAANETKRSGRDPAIIWDLLTWLLLGGIIGARLYHVITPPPSMMPAGTPNPYFQNPAAILQIWRGGLGIPGGIAGGAITLYIYTRTHKLNFAAWADLIMPAVLLGQAVGRWGNYVNMELYGLPTDLPWGIYIPPQYRIEQYTNFSIYHPLFLYESLLNLCGCILLLYISRKSYKKLQPGDITISYFIVYPVIRFFLEYLRVDSSKFGTVNANQSLMAIIASISIFSIIIRIFLKIRQSKSKI